MQFLPSSLLAQTALGGWTQTMDKFARTPLSQVVMAIAALTVIRILIYLVQSKTDSHLLQSGPHKFAKFISETCDAIVYAGGFVFLLIRPFAFQTFFIPSESMIPTLLIGDTIIANKVVYRTGQPKVNDIVVFRPPAEILGEKEGGVDYIKRCIGVPGDVVELRQDSLYRNGIKIEEPYVKNGKSEFDFKLVKDGDRYIPVSIFDDKCNFKMGYTAPSFMVDYDDNERQDLLMGGKPAAIPPDHFLMMGDNRNGSFDSRGWGIVPRRNIVAKSEFLFIPIPRMRKTE